MDSQHRIPYTVKFKTAAERENTDNNCITTPSENNNNNNTKENVYSAVIMAEPLVGSLGSHDEHTTAPSGR